MQASRLLSILLTLQARGRLSARDLAAQMEVSERTIHRDVEQLSAAGVPVLALRGREGGFELLPNWQTKLTGLTPIEARAIFMAGLPGPAAQLGLREPMATAQVKLLASLPAEWQADARRVGSRFHLDPVGWYQSSAPVEHLAAVAEAVWGERRLAIRYESWKGDVERTLEPLGLVLKAGDWYVVAGPGASPRTYRLSSIRALRETGASFRRPRRFDLARHWTESIARFEREIIRGTAVLKVTSSGEKRLKGTSAAVGEALARSAEARDRHGWRRVEIPIESEEQAAFDLLRLGDEAVVLEPATLRRRIARLAQATAARYRASRISGV